ncbi:hypothetical protein F5H01DRAFT_108830 [Linnemannia elongata]|nr:hypothetical protein F5H01DRAFT_108830 [Linnemannia elongata]
MTGVSDFSAKVSRHVSQRLHTSIAPLTEANLYRHTVTSPPSQEAKLKHILGYVELQRELIALEEDLYRSVTDKSHWHNPTNTINNNNIELHSSQLAPHNKNTQYPDDETIDQFDLIPIQSPPQQQQPAALAHRRSITGSYHQRKSSSPNPYTSQQQQQRRTPPPLHSPALYMQQQQQLNPSRLIQQQQTVAGTPAQQQRHLDNIPDGLDPTMALPRALPRTKMTHHDQTLFRDSFYSGIGHENDWRQLEELDPDSIAGIHLYGDTSVLHPHAALQQQQQHHHQQQRQQQPSPAAVSPPVNKYPTYEFTPDPTPRNSEWQHERHLQQLQQQAILRQLQYPDDEDEDEGEAKVQMATRLHRRQHSIAQAQQLQFQQQHQQHQRQLVSPPPTFIEKEKKAGRFSSRFSFLTRRRQQSQPQPQSQHQRSESMPSASNEPWLNDFGNKSGGVDRFNTVGHRRSGNHLVVTTAGAGGASPLPLTPSGGPGATTPVDEEQEQFQEEGFPVKNKSRVKQMFKDVFGISRKKCQSPDLAFRDISLPSTHIRSSSTPAHIHQQLYGHPQQLDTSNNNQYQYSATVAQRKGLITPVSRPDTAQSSYRNGNDNTSNNRNQNNNNNNNNNNCYNRSRARESLVDPVQQLGFQKMEFDEDCDLLGGGSGAFPEGHHPYGQTSLTPPPASSVLRHSTSPHRSFLSGSAEYEPVLITAAVASSNINSTLQQQQSQSYGLGLQDGGSAGAVMGGRTSRTTRPPSQMINTTPTTKDYVDSGCDSTGGLEQPYTTTASNATTLNQHHTTTNTNGTATIKGGSIYSQQQQQSHQPYLYSSPQAAIAATAGGGGGQHQKSLSYDHDRAMTMSTYDNGPTIVSMAQVQKVDLEGLRQNPGHYSLQHHHQTPPSHSHHLGMVAVESPFA